CKTETNYEAEQCQGGVTKDIKIVPFTLFERSDPLSKDVADICGCPLDDERDGEYDKGIIKNAHYGPAAFAHQGRCSIYDCVKRVELNRVGPRSNGSGQIAWAIITNDNVEGRSALNSAGTRMSALGQK